MVLPLLGILGLGAALAAKPRYDAWAENTAVRRRAQRAQGLDPGALGGLLGRGEDPEPFYDDMFMSDPMDPAAGRGFLDPLVTPFHYNAQMNRSGLVPPSLLTDTHGLANIQGGYGLAQQGMSDAAAWDRAVLGETGATERQRYGTEAEFRRAAMERQFGLDERRMIEAGSLVRQGMGDMSAMDRLRYEIEHRPVEPRWDFSDPEAFTTFSNQYDAQQTAMQAGEDAIDFMDQYSGLGEMAPSTKAQREEIAARLNLSALPIVAQQIMDAGAMSDEEKPFFQQMAGGDFAAVMGDARGKAVLEALLDRVADMQQRQYQGAQGAGLEYLLMPPMTRRERSGSTARPSPDARRVR